jgi:Uma2 family endonuclease
LVKESATSTAILELPSSMKLFRMDSDRFCDLPPSDQYRLELLNGDVVMAARPSPKHQYFGFELGVALELFARSRNLGIVLPHTLMTLDTRWTPVPDVCFLFEKHLRRLGDKRINGPVDLAVEVISPGYEHQDRETKHEGYARFGIPWYWIADLEEATLEEYELVGGSYQEPVVVPFKTPFQPRMFPGLTIKLAELVLPSAAPAPPNPV